MLVGEEQRGRKRNLQVEDGDSVPVGFADDAVEILEPGGQEGSERPLHADGLSLREAQEVSAPDAPHGSGLRGVQGDQVELWGEVRLVSSPPAEAQSGSVGVSRLPPGLQRAGGPGSPERQVFVEW